MSLNLTINRNRALVLELRRIASAIERSNELKELELNNLGLTTRTTPAKAEDLNDTQVAYTDPRLESTLRELESRAGRPLSEKEAGEIMLALASESDE